MHKVIVIRHSDDDNQNSKYVANLQKNEDGSYSASVGVVKEDGYNDYVSKHGLHFTKALQEYASKQMVIQIIRNIHGLLSRFKMYVMYLILKFQILLQQKM